MIPICDIPFTEGDQDVGANVELLHYRAELQHFVRRKPTRKMRVVKQFLDTNLRDPDQDAQILDRELSVLYMRFQDEQKMKRKLNRLRPLKPKRKAKSQSKKDEANDYTNFKEYHEYLELFADANCNLFSDIKKKEGTNAKIFTKVLLDAKRRSLSPKVKSKTGSILKFGEDDKRSSQRKQSAKLSLSNKLSKDSVITLNHNSSMNLSMTQKAESSNDPNNKSNAFVLSGYSGTVPSRPPTYYAKKSNYSDNQQGNRSFEVTQQRLGFPFSKKKVDSRALGLNSKEIIDLKQKIIDHQFDRPRFVKKEIPFQFDKKFIGSRKLQEKKFEFEKKNGLVPRTHLSLSFGR